MHSAPYWNAYVAPYWKAVVAAVIAVATIVASAITDGEITGGEFWNIGLAVVNVFAVYKVENKPMKK